MKRRKRFSYCCLAIGLCLLGAFLVCPAAARAAEKPVLSWSAEILPMDDDNPLLEVPGVKERIAQALTVKLHTLEKNGELPFRLKEVSTDYGLHDFSGDNPIGLVALSTLDTTFDTSYHAGGRTFYRSIVFSGMNIAICSADSASHSWRILGTIPLNGYDVIGDNLNNLRTSPISLQEKADKFADITIKMINEHLSFSKERKLTKDLDFRAMMSDNTYQVTDVTISSQKAQKIFAGREAQIKNIIGSFYTNSYQRKTKRTVYPPRGAGSWKRDVSKNLYTYQMNTPSGTITFSVEEPKNPIKLDFNGVNMQELKSSKESYVRRDIVFKAWLAKTPVEGREKGEVSDYTVRPEIKLENAWIQYDPADVFTELIIDLAENLGAQKR